MFVVHFIVSQNVLLTQLLQKVPTVGEEVKIKGRKGKVMSVNMEDMNARVQVILEEVKKKNATVDKRKRR